MRSAPPLADALLLVVVTPGRGDAALARDVARRAAAGGATALWIRERELPDAERRALVHAIRREAPRLALLVSGDAGLARDEALFGVHLGGADGDPGTARVRLGGAGIVGVSLHDPPDVAAARAADYATLSPFAASTAKSPGARPRPALGAKRFAELRATLALPVVALGGIDETNVEAALAAGADGVAVLRAALEPPDPEARLRRLRACLDAHAAERRR